MNIKSIVGLCLIGAISIVSATNIEGFRNLKWGDSSSKLSNPSLIKKEQFYTYYKIQNEIFSIGSGKVDSITYQFFKNRLFAVSINFKGIQNFLDISTALSMKYDPLVSCRTTYYNAQSCVGEDKQGNSISLNFLYDSSQESGSLFIMSGKISKEIDKVIEEETKKAVTGLHL